MKLGIICLSVCFTLACGNASTPVVQNTTSPNASKSPEKSQTAIAHASESEKPSQTAPSGEKSKWTQSGDAIDTTALDSAVMSAEKTLSAKSGDAAAKKALGAAYLKRAVALTEARQYASALGDYRRTLKHDPSNAEAAEWIERIVSIYQSIGRESPKQGEEPPPLPFSKKS